MRWGREGTVDIAASFKPGVAIDPTRQGRRPLGGLLILSLPQRGRVPPQRQVRENAAVFAL